MHLFPYQWKLSDGYPAQDIPYHGKTVFTTFACGGGSTMGYKLAGYDVIAANDIDNQMRKVYIANHHPKYYIFGDIRKLLTLDYPEAFYNLDILDGSPPCSTFSMAGDRENAWGKTKQFREGQAMQTLDDLFFDFIALAKKLQPKIVISENVKGLVSGNAKGYFLEIMQKFDDAGYDTQAFLLNAATMGVPQRRERVFFLSRRKDLDDLSKIDIAFNESAIPFKQISLSYADERMTINETKNWHLAKPGQAVGKFQTYKKLKMQEVANTIVASNPHYHPIQARRLNYAEETMISSFPLDYQFLNLTPRYLLGMSVPPVMMAQVAHQVYLQWLSNC